MEARTPMFLAWLQRFFEASSSSPAPTGSFPANTTPPQEGTVLGGRYRLLKRLAGRKDGTLFHAEDSSLGLKVTLLVGHRFPPTSTAPRPPLQLKQDACAAMRLSHPFILRTYDWALLDEREVVIMEGVDGETLEERARGRASRRLPPEEAAGFAMDLLEALTYAHNEGMVHLRLTPARVMVGPGDHIRLSDFSHLGTPPPPARTSFWRSGAEQTSRPKARADGVQADIRATAELMATLMLGGTSELPTAQGKTEAATRRRRQQALPTQLQAVLRRAMTDDAADRFTSADQMLAALAKAGFVSRFAAARGRSRTHPGAATRTSAAWDYANELEASEALQSEPTDLGLSPWVGELTASLRTPGTADVPTMDMRAAPVRATSHPSRRSRSITPTFDITLDPEQPSATLVPPRYRSASAPRGPTHPPPDPAPTPLQPLKREWSLDDGDAEEQPTVIVCWEPGLLQSVRESTPRAAPRPAKVWREPAHRPNPDNVPT